MNVLHARPFLAAVLLLAVAGNADCQRVCDVAAMMRPTTSGDPCSSRFELCSRNCRMDTKTHERQDVSAWTKCKQTCAATELVKACNCNLEIRLSEALDFCKGSFRSCRKTCGAARRMPPELKLPEEECLKRCASPSDLWPAGKVPCFSCDRLLAEQKGTPESCLVYCETANVNCIDNAQAFFPR
jgi:hypothetical protein